MAGNIQSASGGITSSQKKRAVRAFTDHDAALIDDIRKEFDRSLAEWYSSIPPYMIPTVFERSVAKVVALRLGQKVKPVKKRKKSSWLPGKRCL